LGAARFSVLPKAIMQYRVRFDHTGVCAL